MFVLCVEFNSFQYYNVFKLYVGVFLFLGYCSSRTLITIFQSLLISRTHRSIVRRIMTVVISKSRAEHESMKATLGTRSIPKKALDDSMAAAYDPIEVESKWYQWWVSQGYFTPDAEAARSNSKKFVMCLPPPNVTGHLHIGHALTMSIEDCMARWHRMRGDATLWLPGTDHAGIATQSVVEKLMYKTDKLTRHDLGREPFLKKVWEWKEEKGSHICQQATRMASSVDWSREFFTMDPKLSVAVTEAFCRFHEQGKMFRDVRLVNWSSYLRTALSDLEVEHEEVAKRTLLPIPGLSDKVEVGVLITFVYYTKLGEPMHVATTRLETMLGDVAIAVNPEDTRYLHLHGAELVHPFFPDRKMRVVADSYVDKDFGTGCVKVTPAHDPNDFLIGKRHGLEMINMLADDGTVCVEGEFFGHHRFVVRRLIEQKLKDLNIFVSKKDHAMKVPKCSRSGDIIEPVLRPQWWMDCSELAASAKAVVASGELKLHPPNMHEGTWNHWLDNVRDWCVSRQLWWGHRIPAYRIVGGDPEKWFVARSMEEARKLANVGENVEMEQDSDVLDTWFSSGLLPMSGLGWPNLEAHPDGVFFPTQMLETGWDILFFWVARMVMMSIGLVGKIPFENVYLHALIRDAHGRKMSKSLGNVIDPIEVIEGISLEQMKQNLLVGNLPESEVKRALKALEEDFPEGIPQCGSDALRFALLAYTLQPRAVNLDIKRIVGYRHFCNKLWNACKFGLGYLADHQVGGIHSILLGASSGSLEFEDEWILSRLSQTAGKCNAALSLNNFAEATNAIYAFWLYDFCDYYLELVKPRMKDNEASGKVAREVLYLCMDWGLRLLHPMMPFLTEELYQRLPTSASKAESICIAAYPEAVLGWQNCLLDEKMTLLKSVIGGFRSQTSQLGIKPNARPVGFVYMADADEAKFVSKVASHVVTLAKLDSNFTVLGAGQVQPTGLVVSVVSDKCTLFIDAAGLVDFKAEIDKLIKRQNLVDKSLAGIEKKKSLPGYTEKVPAEIRADNDTKEEALRGQLSEIANAISMLEKAM